MLFLSVILVIISSYIFVNGLEYAQHRMKWTETFTGSIVSPVFTSFPELIVILVAIFAVGKSAGDQVGIGTIFGEPFMASSLAYSAVLAAVVLAYARKRRKDMSMHLDSDLFLPFLFTAIIFPVLVIPVFFLNRAVQDITGTALILLYILYFVISARKRMSLEENEGGNLLLSRIVKPWIGSIIQISLSAAGLYAGSVILVSSIENIATLYSISPLSLAILIVPVATIVPETMSAFIWAYKGKDTTAVASLVGEKVIFTTLFPGIVLLIIPWEVGAASYFSVLATVTVSAIYLPMVIRRKIPGYALSAGVIFFILFVYFVFII
jgi:cation:H+ antiporter